MTMLNEGRAPMDAVAKMLGHSDPNVTRRFYAHYIDEEIADIYEDAVERAGKRKRRWAE
jgi:integrase